MKIQTSPTPPRRRPPAAVLMKDFQRRQAAMSQRHPERNEHAVTLGQKCSTSRRRCSRCRPSETQFRPRQKWRARSPARFRGGKWSSVRGKKIMDRIRPAAPKRYITPSEVKNQLLTPGKRFCCARASAFITGKLKPHNTVQKRSVADRFRPGMLLGGNDGRRAQERVIFLRAVSRISRSRAVRLWMPCAEILSRIGST